MTSRFRSVVSALDRVGAKLADGQRMRVYPAMLATVAFTLWGVSLATGAHGVDRAGHVVGADFSAFYMAGRFVREGRLVELGSWVTQSDFQHRLVAPAPMTGFTPWINPPFVAYGFAPLARFSYPVALGLFWAISMVALLATLVFVRQRLRLPLPNGRLVILALSYFPVFAAFAYGQTSTLSLALMTAVALALLDGRDLVGGLLLGCFAWKPQLAIGVGAALVFAGRWRAVAGALLAVAGWLGLSDALEPEATRAWFASSPALFALIRKDTYPMEGLASFYGASALLFDGLSTRLASSVSVCLTVAAFVAIHRLWRRVPWRPDTPAFRLALAATLAVGVLVSPHLYLYDLTLMLLPFALLFSTLHATPVGPGKDLSIVGASAWVYILGLPSSYLVLAQQAVTRSLFGHAVALQLETVAVAVWAWRVGRRAIADHDD